MGTLMIGIAIWFVLGVGVALWAMLAKGASNYFECVKELADKETDHKPGYINIDDIR